MYISEIDSECVQYRNLQIRDIVDQNTIDDKCKKELSILKERRKNLNSTRARCHAANASIRHSPPQPLRLGHDAVPPTRRCATSRRSRCASDTMPRRKRAVVPQPDDAAPSTRRCATPCRSRCACDRACCVPARLPLPGSCHRTQQDMQWMRVRH